jgi:hypothetical protein
MKETSIEKFREIYKREFGVELSMEDAAGQAQRLLNFARVVMQPMPKAYLPRYMEIFQEQDKRMS